MSEPEIINPKKRPELSSKLQVRTDNWTKIKCPDPMCEGHMIYLRMHAEFNPNLKLSCCDTCGSLYDLTRLLKRTQWAMIFEHHPDRKDFATKSLFGIKRK